MISSSKFYPAPAPFAPKVGTSANDQTSFFLHDRRRNVLKIRYRTGLVFAVLLILASVTSGGCGSADNEVVEAEGPYVPTEAEQQYLEEQAKLRGQTDQ